MGGDKYFNCSFLWFSIGLFYQSIQPCSTYAITVKVAGLVGYDLE